MEEILHHLAVFIKPYVNNGINYPSTGAGLFPSAVSYSERDFVYQTSKETNKQTNKNKNKQTNSYTSENKATNMTVQNISFSYKLMFVCGPGNSLQKVGLNPWSEKKRQLL